MRALLILFGIGLYAAPSHQHAAMMPPSPDKVLTPNSSTAPPGCKLLSSDKGFPSNETVKAALPNAIFKQWGTLGADWTVQAKNVKDVQAAVNFARDNNVRLTIITTGHDFMGREAARSGLRLDLSAYSEPIVFAPSWKLGDNLTPPPTIAVPDDSDHSHESESHTDGLKARDADADVRSGPHASYLPPNGIRRKKFRYFLKRSGTKLRKRHGGEEVPAYNVIKPVAGQQAVARVNAGTYHEVFYDAADKSGLFPMGAQHGGVGSIGGWAQAGGHNPFAREYGMMSDQILEYEVVTADGKFQKVNQNSNPDLFWALRGGGGGTFGVITAATVKVYPTIPIVVARFFVNSTTSKLWDAVGYFAQRGPIIRDLYGVQGYFYVYHNAFQSVLHFPGRQATLTNAKIAIEPLKAVMDRLAGANTQAVKYYTYKSYKEWYDAEQGNDAMEDAGIKFLSWYDGSDGSAPGQAQAMQNPMSVLPWSIKYPQTPTKRSIRARSMLYRRDEEMAMPARPMSRTYLDSRLLSSAHVLSTTYSALGKLLNQTLPGIPNAHIRGFLYGGGKQALVARDATAINPAWRTMTYHWIVNAVPGNIRHDYDISALAKRFPDAGAYVNEASPGEPNWKSVFWGSNYARLESIKKKVDPKNVFWCSPCVGADMLTYDDERICPNPRYPQAGPAPQTYPDKNSKTGIASLPGVPGITNPLLPIIQEYLSTGKLPDVMPEFDDDWNILPPGHSHEGGGDDHDHGGDGDDHDHDDGDHDHEEEPGHSHESSSAVFVTATSSIVIPTPSSIPPTKPTTTAGHDHGTMTSVPVVTTKPSVTPTTTAAGHDHGAVTTSTKATTASSDGHNHEH